MGVFLKKYAYIILTAAFAAIVLLSGLIIVGRFQRNVVINEVCTSNVACCEDAGGSFPDWIELYNPSEREIDISGYTISRSSKKHQDKYTVAAGTVISPGSYALILSSLASITYLSAGSLTYRFIS